MNPEPIRIAFGKRPDPVFAAFGLLAALLLFAFGAHSILAAPSKQPMDPGHAAQFAFLVQSRLEKDQPGAQLGIAFRDLNTGRLLLDHDADARLTPASTQKLLTTWAALNLLGSDRDFRTTLETSQKPIDGVVSGSLLLRGAGDPAFGSNFFGSENSPQGIFAAWADSLKRLGVKKVTGCVISDATYLNAQGPNPASLWEDIGNYYGGLFSGLNYSDNRYRLYLERGNSPGAPTRVSRTEPAATGILEWHNRILAGPPGKYDSAYIFGSFLSPQRWLSGSYPPGEEEFSIQGSLPYPHFTAAWDLQAFLENRGIVFGAKPALPPLAQALGRSSCTEAAERSDGGYVLASHVSPSLSRLIGHVNQKSDNNHAEVLLAHLGRTRDKAGDFAGGLRSLQVFLVNAGLPEQSFRIKDGSGLSRYNWITPSSLTLLLETAAKGKSAQDFRSSLLGSPPTENMSLRYGKHMPGNLFYKTGTQDGVYALAGYLETRQGRRLAFAILWNQATCSYSQAHQGFGELLRWAHRVL